ncbi:PA domain-containing protein [Nocardioides sp.]|uniref:PA domain-containing protein n=1 Tax=Nocardioides sp. TaxID=35761 RepID=UPI00286DF6A2|nr:PA domain-containing protein [Nocardioides sp.]
MSTHVRRSLARVALAAALVTAFGGTADAHTAPQADGGLPHSDGPRDAHQHGVSSGHLPASATDNIDVVSKLKLKNVVPEKIADVGVYKNYAYLAAWGVVTCKYNGVHVVDISDVGNPKEVAFIGAKHGSYPGEGVQALTIDTPAFQGDVLVSNNEKCNDNAGFGGMNLYDVTNAKAPTPLFEGAGDFTVNGQGKKAANEIHSVFAWDAGDKAYAVIVDNEEGKDVDIIDITNPRKPFLTAEYDLDELFPQIKQAAPSNLVEVFLHDMVVKKIADRQVMLLSYWDAGYVKVDVTNVHNPTYLGDTDFTSPDPEAAESGFIVPPEGNGHQAEFTSDNQYVVGADEDFGPYALVARNDTDGTTITASQGSDTTQLVTGETITGQAKFVGRACLGDPSVPAGDGTQIAVVERGVCTFTEKVANVLAAGGYDAVLIFNRTSSDACNQTLGMSVDGDISTFGVAPRQQGYAIFGVQGQYDDAACLAGDGTQLAPITVGALGDTLTFSSYFDGWGYVHLFRNTNGKMTELDTYAIPEAHDPDFASGFGDLSVHEVATSHQQANRLYFSYYAGGFRVAEIQGDKIVEKGHYIDASGNNFWGVQVFEQGGTEYVAASDRDYGLWIFKYTG